MRCNVHFILYFINKKLTVKFTYKRADSFFSSFCERIEYKNGLRWNFTCVYPGKDF